MAPPPSQEFIDAINELGFTRADKFETLGLKLNSKLDNINSNWDKILAKCKKIVNFWNLFFLSTPGRVNIIKQFLYSQLSYLGTILTPPEQFFDEFRELIIRFLKHAAKVSKDRIFIECKDGGLGLVEPKIFVQSLQVNMYLRGFKSTDWWGSELKSFLMHPSIPHSIDFLRLTPRYNPIIHSLAKAFYAFAKNFFSHKGNIKYLQIMGNDFYTNFHLNSAFFEPITWNLIKNCFHLVKFGHICDQNANLVDFDTFKARTGCNLPFPEFLRLAEFLTPILQSEKNCFDQKPTSILTIVNRKKVKSKFFRKFLNPPSFKIANCRPSRSRNLWSIAQLDPFRESRFFTSWTISFIPMNVREFAFKFLNNFLYLNANKAKMLRNEDLAKCFFCDNYSVNQNDIPHENYRHFFLQCPISDVHINQYFREFLIRGNFGWIIWQRKFLLIGAPPFLDSERASILNIELITSAFFLFQCKLRKIQPSYTLLKDHCDYYREIYSFSPAYSRAWRKWQGVN